MLMMMIHACMQIAQVVKIGIAIAIILIVALHLQNVSFSYSGDPNVQFQCLLGGNIGGSSLCSYAYAVCGLSLAINLGVSIVLCCTCDLVSVIAWSPNHICAWSPYHIPAQCGLGCLLECAFSGVGTAWWLAASLVFSKYVSVRIASRGGEPGW